MEERIRFIAHQGKNILLCDLSHLPAEEVRRITGLLPKFVTQHPKGSLLLLADFTGVEFDRATVDALKESTVFDRPHIRKSAWIGTENLPHIFYEHLKLFSRRDLPTFKTREEALDWLVKEDSL